MEGRKKSGNGHPWTDEEIEKLRRMRKEGKTYKECSKELPGRSESACQQFDKNGHTNGHKNGNGEKTRWTPEEEERLNLLHKEGYSSKDIFFMNIFNKSEKAIRNKISRMQNGKKTRWTKEEKKFLVRMHENLPILEIAEILNKNNDSVINEIKSLMESNEWEKLVKEVIEEDKVNKDEDSDDESDDDDLLKLLEEDVNSLKKDTNEKLKL